LLRNDERSRNRTPSSATPSTRATSRRRAVRRFRWSILAPLIALFALVLLPVLFLQLYFSFHQWTVYLGSWWDAEFVGLDLFAEVLTDRRFGWAIVRSLGFATASTIGCFVVGFALAYLMRKPFPGRAAFSVVFILPMLTVPIVIAYTAEMLLYQSGPINDIISRLTGTAFRVAWLTDPSIAMLAVTLLEIWNWTPFSFIIMLAGLAAIPKEPLEAAEILGASRWRIFWEVQLPLLRPVIFLALVLRFLEAMAEFPKTWALFQGGPGTATETIPVYIFLTTWQYFQISKGAALSYIAMMLMIVIVLLAIRLLRREKRALDAMYAHRGSEGAA
jgi:multiple sugar transport system permease protein